VSLDKGETEPRPGAEFLFLEPAPNGAHNPGSNRNSWLEWQDDGEANQTNCQKDRGRGSGKVLACQTATPNFLSSNPLPEWRDRRAVRGRLAASRLGTLGWTRGGHCPPQVRPQRRFPAADCSIVLLGPALPGKVHPTLRHGCSEALFCEDRPGIRLPGVKPRLNLRMLFCLTRRAPAVWGKRTLRSVLGRHPLAPLSLGVTLVPPVPLRSPPSWRHDPRLSPRERRVALGAGMARWRLRGCHKGPNRIETRARTS
jgi:hypothetical protein